MLLEILLLLLVITTITHVIDYRVLKNRIFQSRKWGLNISCGPTDGGGVNADIVRRDVPNFVLVKDIYNLPFKDKEFKSAVCSHTMEHVGDPDRFHKELMRVSEEVVVIIPPVWDLAAILTPEHKWQFLTLREEHTNELPRKVRLPFYYLHKVIGDIVT